MSFLFENVNVEIINISEYLKINSSKIFNSSKILVGEYKNRLYGFIVDRVVEIINLNGEYENLIVNSKKDFHHENVLFIEISGDKYQLFNIEKFLEKKFLKNRVE